MTDDLPTTEQAYRDLRKRLQDLKDEEATATNYLHRLQGHRQKVEAELLDLVMAAAYGIKRGDVIAYSKSRGVIARTKKRLRIMSFSGFSQEAERIWIQGRCMHADGTEGVRMETIYGMGSITLEGKAD